MSSPSQVPGAPQGSARASIRSGAICAIGVAAGLVALGWTTGLRQLLHGALLTMGVVAFLPFVFLACALAALLALCVALAVAGAGTGIAEAGAGGLWEGSIEGGGGPALRWVGRYYLLLGRIRHPLLLGAAAGVLLGTLLCWGLLAVFVVPRETRTLAGLLDLQVHIEQYRAREGRYPAADPSTGQLLDASLLSSDLRSRAEPRASTSSPARDAFGEPLRYALRGVWKAQSYRLSSLGADGRESGDDLCVTGKTRLAALADMALAPVKALELMRGEDATWSSRLSLLRAARCTAW